MNKQAIEKKAKRIMSIDAQIWQKYGWQSGDNVNQEIYQMELNKKIKGKIPIIYYYIFEDANYHSLNKTLEESGKFVGKYGSNKAEQDFREYKRMGGRTWQL